MIQSFRFEQRYVQTLTNRVLRLRTLGRGLLGPFTGKGARCAQARRGLASCAERDKHLRGYPCAPVKAYIPQLGRFALNLH